MDVQFAQVLKEWRGRRRMSQLDLGLTANVSTRHVAFLETGRSRPSREMVIQLAEALEVPRPARNTMLNAAGFAPAYRARALDASDMAVVREALDWMVARHDPYPALAIDRHWAVVSANQTATALLGAFGIGVGGSLIDALCEPGRGAQMLENWAEAGHHMLMRLRTESAHHGGDQVLDTAAARLSEDPEIRCFTPLAPLAPVIPVRYRAGSAVLSFISTIAQFGTVEDIALADLRIELLFPADEATRDFLATNRDRNHA
jgi:transcriptional regulator with XRE-family HTH domain